MNKKLVSVILPVFNRENYIGVSIKSILAQTYKEFELIIIDDGSTDRTPDILEYYRKRDSRISIYYNFDNKGVTVSLQRAIGLSNGYFVARMDSDDVSFSRRFEKQVEHLEKSEGPCVLGTQFQKVDDKGSLIKPRSYRSCTALTVWWDMFFYPSIVHPTVMAHREVMCKFNESNMEIYFPDAEDHAFWLRMGFITRMENLPDILFYFRRHSSRVTSSTNLVQINSSERAIQGALKKAIGREISISAIQSYKNPVTINNREIAYEAMKALIDLYIFFVNSYFISFFDKKIIRDKLTTCFLNYEETFRIINPRISKDARDLLKKLLLLI